MPKELWTAQECADYLKITKKSLYMKVYRGELPVIKFGNASSTLRFDPAEIEAYLENHRIKAFEK